MKVATKPRVFIDMDGVIVDFDGYKEVMKMTSDQVKELRGAYLNMLPLQGALDAVQQVIDLGYDVFIATKPPTGISYAYSDKAQWIFNHLPQLSRKIIITSDKGLLGNENDYLIDDHPEWGNCKQFRGKLIPFKHGDWPLVVEYLAKNKQ